MSTEPFCPISGESVQEERFNYLTHLIGLFLSLIGWVVLLIHTSFTANYWYFISCSVYGTTLVLLYAASAYYHRCQVLDHKRKMQIIDHICIYLLIAGTYTPFTLGPLRNSGGWSLLTLEWVIASIGITLKLVSFNRFQILSVCAYLGMGWLVVFSFPTLMEELTLNAIIWLISGGVAYSLGVIFYIWNTLPFNHTIWHLFVLGGSVCHYCSILDMIQH